MKPLRIYLPYEVVQNLFRKYEIAVAELRWYITTAIGDYGFLVIYNSAKPSRVKSEILDRMKEILCYSQDAVYSSRLEKFLFECSKEDRSVRVGIDILDSYNGKLMSEYRDYIIVLNPER